MTRQCFLKCLLDSHAPIKLPHNVETFVGRSKLTLIKDQACSRKQLILKADCDQCLLEVKQIGINPSGLDGYALKKDGLYKIKHGSKIEILLNQYFHLVEFDPPPDDYEVPNQGNKRKKDTISPERQNKLIKIDNKNSVLVSMEDKWEDFENREVYVFTSKGVKSSSKIAAFDMDGTLIKTKSGKVHPVDTKDWQIIFPSVPSKLAEKFEDGYKVIILSNQSPIGSGRVKIEDFKIKIENIVSKLGIPIQVFFATGKGFYRKPAPGMWNILSKEKNDNILIDMEKSFYCGDAAGRNANWAPGKKKDFSMADILFAENLGLKFFTPEQYFLGHSIANVPKSRPEFIPKDLKPTTFDGKLIICRDVLGSWQKCSTEATKFLKFLISKFVEPSKSEGFQDVINVKFNPTFEDKEAERVYRMFLLE
ncbi:unnamed protein product, partial [Leptidea sinapis]